MAGALLLIGQRRVGMHDVFYRFFFRAQIASKGIRYILIRYQTLHIVPRALSEVIFEQRGQDEALSTA